MAFNKITDADLVGKGVIGLPDTPNLSTTEMQNKFEETVRGVAIPKINEVIEGLNGSEVSNSSKAINPVSGNEESFQNTFNALKKYTDDEVTKERTKASDELKVHTDNKENPHAVTAEQVNAYTKQAVDDKLSDKVDKVEGKGLSTNDYDNSEKEKLADADSKKHEHSNKSVLDSITDTLLSALNRIATIFSTITGITTSVVNDDTKIPTSGAIVDYVTGLGGGDMTKAEYDADGDGVVDDSGKLGGQLPSYYAKDSEAVKYVSAGSAGEFNPPSYNAQILGGKYTASDIDEIRMIASEANTGLFDKLNFVTVDCSNVAITQENNGHYVSGSIAFELPQYAIPIMAYQIDSVTAGVSLGAFSSSDTSFILQSDTSVTLPSGSSFRVIYYNRA